MISAGTESAVLCAVFTLNTPTRTSIATTADMSLVAVSAALDVLQRKALIRRSGKNPSGAGRPSVVYELCGTNGFSLGVAYDLDSVTAVAVDAAKSTLLHHRFDHAHAGARSPIDVIIDVCEEVLGAPELAGKSLRAIGLGLAGVVSPAMGTWVQGLRIAGADNLDVRGRLSDRYHVPVVVEDVARTIAYFERACGSGKGADDIVVLHLGSGVGAGIVIGGKLYGGRHGLSGEIGHIVVDPGGYRCTCGNTGCLETVLSSAGIVRRLRDRVTEVGVPLPGFDFLQGRDARGEFDVIEDIARASAGGDRLVRSVLLEIGSYLGDACTKLVSLYDPERLLVTGRCAMLGPFLEESMRQTVANRIVASFRPDLHIAFSQYEPTHEAAGAALLAMEESLTRGINGETPADRAG